MRGIHLGSIVLDGYADMADQRLIDDAVNDITVVVTATFFPGMPPEQVENDITSRQERFFTLAPGIDHIESGSLPGVSIIKIYFQPGTNPDTAVSPMANLAAAVCPQCYVRRQQLHESVDVTTGGGGEKPLGDLLLP